MHFSIGPAGKNKLVLGVTVAMSGSVVNVLACQLTGRYHVQRQCRVCVPSAIGPFQLFWKGFCSGALFPQPKVINIRFYQVYQIACSSLESTALKACFILIALTLQKLTEPAKSTNHVAHLNCRVALRKDLEDGGFRDILATFRSVPEIRIAIASYTLLTLNLMLQGKVHSAFCYLGIYLVMHLLVF